MTAYIYVCKIGVYHNTCFTCNVRVCYRELNKLSNAWPFKLLIPHLSLCKYVRTWHVDYRVRHSSTFVFMPMAWGLNVGMSAMNRSIDDHPPNYMVAELCHFVLSCFRGEKAPRQMVNFSCFRMATFQPATRKYDCFHASSFRLLCVVSLPGGAKGRHAKTRPNHHFAGFRVATFRPARRKRERRHAKMVKNHYLAGFLVATFRVFVPRSCFRMAIFCPATRKYATFHVLHFQLLFVVSLPGGAKGRNAKPRQNHHLAGFRMATFRVFAPKTRLYDMAQISHHTIICSS